MPKFLHAADLHVDSPLSGLEQREGAPVERIRAATRRALENLVELALRERVAFVLLAGDTFDTDPMLETELFFRGQMQRLTDAKIPVVVVLGNHDHAGIAPTKVRLPSNVTVLPHDRADSHSPVPGVVVHGRSYPRRDYDLDLSLDYPSPYPGSLNVGLLHTALTDTHHKRYAPTTPATLAARGYRYWALGHVHQRSAIEERGVPIVFPGNLQGRHARETGPKGAVIVAYERDRIGAIEHRPLDVVRWHHLELDAATLEGDLVGAVKMRVLAATAGDREARRLCAVRVTIAGVPVSGAPRTSADGLRDALLGELYDARGELWLEKVRVETRGARVGASELESQLVGLTQTLANDERARGELVEIVNAIRDRLDKVDSTLARPDSASAVQAESLIGDRAAMSVEDAESLLARALGVALAERR